MSEAGNVTTQWPATGNGAAGRTGARPDPASGGDTGLRAAIRSGRYAVTAEIGPPRGADPEMIRRKAALLRGWVDAANITDNQSAYVRLSSWAGGVLAKEEGVSPVLQLTSRDRNRIALQSDLLSAAALGMPNVLLLSGDHPCFGDHPGAKPVFDIDSVQLVWMARAMCDEGRLLSGRRLSPPPELFVGAVENPFAPPARFRARRAAKKVAAGAEFIQTQFVFDVEAFERWMVEVRDLGLHERCAVLAGVGPIRSLRALDHMQHNVPGLHIPEDLARRLRGAAERGGEDEVAAEGVRACVETIQRLQEIPGVAGFHVMALNYERGVPDILRRAGLAPATRGQPAPPVPAGTGGHALDGPLDEGSTRAH